MVIAGAEGHLVERDTTRLSPGSRPVTKMRF